MNFITNEFGEPLSPRNVLAVQDIVGKEIEAISNETITYNGKAAAGAITINATVQRPILTTEGDRIGSYWGNTENLVRTYTNNFSVVKTDGAAALAITDATNNLELAFESATTYRYVAKVTDYDGTVLYGWIAGVAASGNTYTCTIYNARTGTTNNWVGTPANFDATHVVRLEIFKTGTSINFDTGTTLTKEVRLPFEASQTWQKYFDWALTLANGEYAVDYLRGLIIGKRADTTASETMDYNTYKANT